MYSLSNFIKTFLSDEERIGSYGMCFANMIGAIEWIEDFDPGRFKMDLMFYRVKKKEGEIKRGVHKYRRRMRGGKMDVVLGGVDFTKFDLF
jgi:hypothetical protein